MHDISHVHQLWSVASEICGNDYPINPLEGFVLGAAFLIHDAGLTASAYPGGLPALRETDYYRDRVAAILRSQANDAPDEASLKNPPNDVSQRALFDTLRAIHAERAETLLDEEKVHPLTGRQYPLFPDPDLFLDCGNAIGLIAASHYWNIDQVDERFRDPLTPPAAFPGWTIDVVKLACILRAADACAIDERRARIMPFLLANPSGTSRDHWKFQALIKPGFRREEAVVFQSKWPFSRQDMAAWWVAYDSIRLADRELRDCDRLLRDRLISARHTNLKPFPARRVEGAGEPGQLKNVVEVTGWTPVDTAIRIDNPISIVEKLGGWHLYGNDVSAPLREALQNAADAVRARRRRKAASGTTSTYKGRIDIHFDCDPNDEELGNLRMIISDDGIGMLPGTMTGGLLDFGRSFWDSTDAALLYPGLLSDPFFKPTGKFGIGFYSIFMVADDVKVISRLWDAGVKTAGVLHFRNGAKERAEFRNFNPYEDSECSASHSTTLVAVIKAPEWLWRFGSLAKAEPSIEKISMDQFWEYLVLAFRRLVFALDVECWLSFGNVPTKKLNDPGVLELPASDFANSYNSVFVSSSTLTSNAFSPEEVPLIDDIRDKQGRTHTRGSIIAQHGVSGFWHIGGFLCPLGSGLMKGISAAIPVTASRHQIAYLASKDQVRYWAESQLRRLATSSVDPGFRITAIAHLCSIDVDIYQSAMVIADGAPKAIKDIVEGLRPKETAKIFVVGRRYKFPFSTAVFSLDPNLPFFGFGFSDLKDRAHDVCVSGAVSHASSRYFEIHGSLDAPTNQNSAYGALRKALEDTGFEITTTLPGEYVVGKYDGPEGGHSLLMVRDLLPGKEVKGFGFVMHVTQSMPKAPARARGARRRPRTRKRRHSS